MPVSVQPLVIPWYKSAVLRGIIISVATQALAHSKFAAQFSSDDVATVVNYVLEGVSTVALFYAAHARIVKQNPAITSTQKDADAAIEKVGPQAVSQATTTLAAVMQKEPTK